MYNLLVSGDPDAWESREYEYERDRCLTEYTDKEISKQFLDFSDKSIEFLREIPCIFAYESHCKKPPKFGRIGEISRRSGGIRVRCNFEELDRFLTQDDLLHISRDLDIGKWELNRTHWALKDVNLVEELNKAGFPLPAWVKGLKNLVNLDDHVFDVSLSFPGEIRSLVEEVSSHLERSLGPNMYFYDNNYRSQLARPNLDLLLQSIYSKRSKLIVAFIGDDYQKKDWCGIEFRAIREIINARGTNVMYIRLDDGNVDGVLNTDGFLDARELNPSEIAHFIRERAALNLE
ncbi:MAG TPA: TIR domain-containing protein [Aurantimonas coralicida]|uniref:TIR domain-containing protein n=2 Tax=root TaxID=1 RepID=A0A9C9NJ10_9HYPH|nr:TIR domain-containing protein [Aurantimonas coralicida]HEU02855.1 TIR domain-containing protein [Aurantimonas coralicida]